MNIFQRLQQVKRWLTDWPAIPWLLVLLLAGAGLGEPLLPTRSALLALSRMSAPRLPAAQTIAPFMHKPYYGTDDFHSRITSFFDHDKPWYANDKIFVRYDGKRWTGSDTSVVNCQAGATCYDGHNGYDLRMRFEPVLSSAAGKVLNAGWYNPQNHNDSFGLWVAIDHGNGVANVYGHLSALTVSVGQQVGTQWQIGTSGTTGSSTGPHLHFGTYYYPSWQPTDPSGWSSRRADPNTVPDLNLWSTGDNVTPVPLLGGQGKKLAPGAVLVDDGAPGWSSTGQWSSARAKSDIGGSLHWTSTTGGSATATATWQTLLPAAGYYEVGAFVDDNHASSGWASYTISSSDPTHPANTVKHHVQVDQEHVGIFQNAFGSVNTGAQWIGLGTYYFTDKQPGRVVLNNATGEDAQQITADGIEFAPLTPQRYAFALTEDTTPAQMTTGGHPSVNLTLTNTSSFRWPAQGLNAVQMIYRWLDSQGQAVLTSSPISLSQDLPINASETSTTEVQAPVQAGTYTLQWDLIQGTRVFSLEGAHPQSHRIIVSDPASAPIAPPGTAPPTGPPVSPGAIPPASPTATTDTGPLPAPTASPTVPPRAAPTASPGSNQPAPPGNDARSLRNNVLRKRNSPTTQMHL